MEKTLIQGFASFMSKQSHKLRTLLRRLQMPWESPRNESVRLSHRHFENFAEDSNNLLKTKALILPNYNDDT